MFDLIPNNFFFSLLCFDLDETIIDYSKKTDEKLMRKFNQSLKEQKERGAIIVYASARNKKDTLEAVRKYNLIDPDFIITDLGLCVFSISRSNSVRKLKFNLKIGSWNSGLIGKLNHEFPELIPRKSSRSSLYKKTYYVRGENDKVIKKIQRYLKKERQDAAVYESGNNSIYIIPKNCSKGNALLFIEKQLRIRSDDIFVSGDSQSDFSLFKMAPHSVLVANANAVTKKLIKEHYSHVFVSKKNHQEGVLEGWKYFNQIYNKDIFSTLKITAPLFVNGSFEKVISKIRKRIDNFERTTSYKTKIIRRLILGYAYEKQGLFIKAKSEYIKCSEYSENITDLYIKTLSNIQLAKIYISLGKIDKGIKILNKNLPLGKGDNFNNIEIYRLNSLAYGYRLKGSLDLANEILREAEKLSRNSFLYASVLHNKAGLYRDLKKYKQSLSIYKKIMKFANPKDLFFTARINNNIGFIYRKLGFYDKAWEFYLKSYQIEKKMGYQQLQGRTLNNLGGVSKMKKKYSSALKYFSASVKLRRKIKDGSGLSSSLLNKGIVLGEMGRYKESKRFLKDSLRIRKKIGSRHLIKEALDELKKYD